jgi:hypothetical protein
MAEALARQKPAKSANPLAPVESIGVSPALAKLLG